MSNFGMSGEKDVTEDNIKTGEKEGQRVNGVSSSKPKKCYS